MFRTPASLKTLLLYQSITQKIHWRWASVGNATCANKFSCPLRVILLTCVTHNIRKSEYLQISVSVFLRSGTRLPFIFKKIYLCRSRKKSQALWKAQTQPLFLAAGTAPELTKATFPSKKRYFSPSASLLWGTPAAAFRRIHGKLWASVALAGPGACSAVPK